MEEAPPKFIHEWHEDTENLDSYQPGWYHPVDIGQVYSEGRYRIIHKLGFGTYSTVWLARDSRLERYVALKILAAEPSKDSTESQIIRQISQSFKTSSHINKAFILPILDEFDIHGPNGQHRCLATEPAACSLSVSKSYPPWVFRIEVARAIAAQTILALRAIHQCNVVHGGKSRMPSCLPYADYLHDLHLHNILFTLRDINHMSVDEIYHHFSTPEKIKVNRVDGGPLAPGVPSHSISPANVFVDSLKVDDPHIYITDFGESWLGDAVHPKGYLNTPMLYRPPEAIFAKELLSFPADIWTLACSVFEIMGERGLFEAFFPDEADMVAEMVSCLGPLPSSWWDAWEGRSEFFVEKGVWRTDMTRPREPRSRPLRSRIQTMGRQEHPDSLSADEAESLAVMLTTMLEYDPAKRATADDVVNSDWMTRWGLPSLKPFNIPV